jgi:hypothetical protein
VVDESNEHDLTIMAHASEVVGRGVSDTRDFFCFLVVEMVPSMSLFLHAVLSTYDAVLAHLHTIALLALAIFQHFCEAYVGVHPLVALFRIFFEARLDTSGAISGCLIFRLCPHIVMRFITMPQKDWEEWRANWCFLRFSEVDDPMAYTELTSAPEALPIWTSPASMAGLEATVERIQLLRDLHLAAHHVLNSFIRHNIMLLQ